MTETYSVRFPKFFIIAQTIGGVFVFGVVGYSKHSYPKIVMAIGSLVFLEFF